MQNRTINNNPELVNFFNQQSSGWFLTHAASVIVIPVTCFTIAAQLSANHPIISKLASLIAILDMAEPFYANYFNKPGPFMQATSLAYRAGSNFYQTFFGAKPAANSFKPASSTALTASKKPG